MTDRAHAHTKAREQYSTPEPEPEVRQEIPPDPPEAYQSQHDQGADDAETLTIEELEDLAEPDWEKSVEVISIDELITFDRAKDPDNRFGNRWLCAGDTVVFQGETGVGKSVLTMQMVIYWAFWRALFGIKGSRAYKSLLIESENNKGDLAEVFQDVTKAMGLTAEEIAYLKTKIVIIRESAKTGREFLKLARRLIKKYQPDLVFVDPFLSYLGDNASDQKAMSAFLRNGLTPIVQASNVVWFWVHHFSKPSRDEKPSVRRSVYSGFGSVELPGWARETMTLNVVSAAEWLYEIVFGKRARRVGLADENGNPLDRVYIRQSKTGVLWEDADPVQAKEAGNIVAAKYGSATNQIRAFIEKNVSVTISQLEAFAPRIPVGEKRVKSIARALVADANEPRIYEYKLKGITNGIQAFSTVTRELNPLAYFPPKKRRIQAKTRQAAPTKEPEAKKPEKRRIQAKTHQHPAKPLPQRNQQIASDYIDESRQRSLSACLDSGKTRQAAPTKEPTTI
jgi:hypothetical protein